MPLRVLFLLSLMLVTNPLSAFAAAAAEQPVALDREAVISERIRQRIEQIASGFNRRVGGELIAARGLLPKLYAARRFAPLWLDPGRRRELRELVVGSAQQGLDPADYHLPALARSADGGEAGIDALPMAERDILLTDAFVRLEHHLRFGKVDPFLLDPHWNFDPKAETGDPLVNLRAALAADSLVAHFRAAFPRGVLYTTLTEALARYREIAHRGDWASVDSGPTLKPGMRDARVPALRARLAAEFEVPAGGDTMLYDEDLEALVKRFQERYGIAPDGIVGPDTRATMNVPVQDRIDQIRVNLDRARWVLDPPRSDYLVINIAGFHAFLMRHERIIYESRVVVGTPYRKTPVFRSQIAYLVFNPTWTVPPTIFRKDVLPKVMTDLSYLADHEIDVLDSNGRIVDPDGIDWGRYTKGGFPYQLVQRPGARNALGRIKFIFPNPYSVYLHDTPRRDLFSKPGRTFSSGCIRLERPLELAELLLAGPGGWDRAAIDQAIAVGKTRTVFPPRQLPIMLLYWTAGLGPAGEFGFHPDVYDRDAAVLRALDSTFEPLLKPHHSVRPGQAAG